VPRAARPVFGTAPVESFTVVMATAIVAAAARADERPMVALALAVLAGCGLVAVVAWVALARAGSGHRAPCGTRRIDHGCGLFGFVAAVDLVAAQFDVPGATGVVALLGAVAVAAWLLLVVHGAGLVHTGGWTAIHAVREAAGCSWWSRPSRSCSSPPGSRWRSAPPPAPCSWRPWSGG
jgi:hypothetical protein